MHQEWLLYPLFAMASLTFYVSVRLLKLRIKAVRNRDLRISYFRYNRDVELPDDLAKTTRHYANLFEFPLLFYIVVIMTYVTQQGDYSHLALAWAYVISRAAHAYIHLGSNNILHRKNTFLVSWFILAAIWLKLFLQLMTS